MGNLIILEKEIFLTLVQIPEIRKENFERFDYIKHINNNSMLKEK